MSVKEVTELFNEDGLDAFEHIIEDEGWVCDHKYETTSSVVMYKDKYYQINQSRSGSYYTDYHYNDPDIFEVTRHEERVMVTKVTWQVVK